MLHLANAMQRAGHKTGIATECIGGGLGGAMLLEAVLMTGPVLKYLGETKLELGPATKEAHPWRRGEADGVVWLVLDCEGKSVNTVSRDVIEGLAGELDDLEENVPKGVVIRSAKIAGFAVGPTYNGFDDMAGEAAADPPQTWP